MPRISRSTATVSPSLATGLPSTGPLVVEGLSLPVHPGPVAPSWTRAAAGKGFDIAARVKDRLHLALRCRTCGHVFTCRIFTLRSSQPICHACLERSRADLAARAGLTYLRRDPGSTQYGRYRAACGHEQRRQFDYVRRMAEGMVGLRCETCFAADEARIAARLDWTRVAPDPRSNPNYHLYDHECGHRQRIARANLRWGQVDCARCGQSWTARKSRIYLLELRHGARHLLKLGYSAHPEKRHRHQLGLPRGTEVRILREIALPTGHAACVAEKRLHRDLGRAFPDAVVPPAELAGLTNVVSEIYRPGLRAEIEARLDALAAGLASDPALAAGATCT